MKPNFKPNPSDASLKILQEEMVCEKHFTNAIPQTWGLDKIKGN